MRLTISQRFSNLRVVPIMAIVAAILAYAWFASTPLPIGGPNVVVAAIAVILSFTLLNGRIRRFNYATPIIFVSVALLVWIIAIRMLTDTTSLSRVGQVALGIGIMVAVIVVVSNALSMRILIDTIVLGVFVSAAFGLCLNYFGEPFLSIWLRVTEQDIRHIAPIWSGRIAGLSATVAGLGYLLTIGVPMALATHLNNPLRPPPLRVVWDVATYLILICLIIAVIMNASRSVILGTVCGSLVIIALSLPSRAVRRRLFRTLPALILGVVAFILVDHQLVSIDRQVDPTDGVAVDAQPAIQGHEPPSELRDTTSESNETKEQEDLGSNVALDRQDSPTSGVAVDAQPEMQGSEPPSELGNTRSDLKKSEGQKDLGPKVTVDRQDNPTAAITVTARPELEVSRPPVELDAIRSELTDAVRRKDLTSIDAIQQDLEGQLGSETSNETLSRAIGHTFDTSRTKKFNSRVLAISDRSARIRLPMMGTAVRYSLNYPIGTGVYRPDRSHIPKDAPTDLVDRLLGQVPHNQFLHVLVLYGFPGLLLLVLFYTLVFRSLLDSARSALRSRDEGFLYLTAAIGGATVAYVITSMFQPPGPFIGDWFHFYLIGLVFCLGATLGQVGSGQSVASKNQISIGSRCITFIRRTGTGY